MPILYETYAKPSRLAQEHECRYISAREGWYCPVCDRYWLVYSECLAHLEAVKKKPTSLTCYAYPTEGTPPFEVMINGRLMTDYAGLNKKLIELYENGVKVDEMLTYRSDARDGTYLFKRRITKEGVYEYYVSFPGDADYEGC